MGVCIELRFGPAKCRPKNEFVGPAVTEIAGLNFVFTAEPLSTSRFRKLTPRPNHSNPSSAIHSSVCFRGGAGAGNDRPPPQRR